MAQLGLACKATSRACAKAGIAGLFGLAGEVNSTGDDQKKLDVLSDEIFVSALINSGACAVLVSEERDEAIIVPKEKAGRFCVAFDPLDGAQPRPRFSSQPHQFTAACANSTLAPSHQVRPPSPDPTSSLLMVGRTAARFIQHRLQRVHRHHLRRVREAARVALQPPDRGRHHADRQRHRRRRWVRHSRSPCLDDRHCQPHSGQSNSSGARRPPITANLFSPTL
eukprot:scaffold16601_cov91-Isochrysis_galbana.AAC.2